MNALTVKQAVENVYGSLDNDNEDIDLHVAALKEALDSEGLKHADFDSTRLAVSNRAGRKMMQSYFKKRGVTVKFTG